MRESSTGSAAAAAAAADAGDPARPFRVAIIEDNPHDRAEVKSLLLRGSPRRYAFAEADLGGAGLGLCLADPPPDCVVMDFDLPDMSALDVLAALPRARGVACVPVVILTGMEDARVSRDVLRAGAQDFVGKGWMTAGSLSRAVENAVERHRAAGNLARHVERQATLVDLTRVILGNNRDEAELVAAAFAHAGPHLDADVCFFYRPVDGGGLDLGWHAGVPADRLADAGQLARGQPLCGRAGATRRPVALGAADLAADPAAAFAVGLGVRAFVGHPLLDSHGAVMGTLSLASTRRAGFDADDLAFVQTVGNLLGTAFERRRAGAAARAAAEFNRGLMDGTADCVKVLDLGGRLQFMNAPGLCQMEIDDFGPYCGRPWASLWPDGPAQAEARRAVARAAAGVAGTVQGFCPTAKGTPKWWDVTVSPVRDTPGGPVVRLVSISRDVTDRRVAEQAVRASESRLALGVQVAGLALAEIDYAADVIHLSAEAARLYGVGTEAATVSRAAVHAAFHPADRAAAADHIARAVDPAGPGTCNADHRVVWPDGQVRWVRVREQVFFDGVGPARRAARATLAVMDVTAERAAAAAVAEGREFVRGVLDSLPEHVVVLDERGRITAVNAPWERFAAENGGRLPAVGVGADYLAECRRAAATGDAHAAEAADGIEAVLAGRRESAVVEYPCPGVGRDADRWFLMHAKRASYGPPGAILTHVEITERRRAEQTVRRREAELRTITDAVPDVIARFDRDLRHVFVNAAVTAATGLPPEAVIGKTNRQLWMPAELCDRWEGSLRSVFQTGHGEQATFAFSGPDGERRFDARLVPEPGPDGRVAHVLAVTRDVTAAWRAGQDVARAKEAAESANAAKDHFLAVLSHELRTPLTPVRIALALWESAPDELPLAVRRDLAMVRRNIDLECRLIDDMLDLNRIARGKLELQFARVDLHAEVRHAIRTVEADAAAKQVVLSFDPDAEMADVVADAGRIQQVLWNLLTNAVKFTPPGGSVAVRTYNSPVGHVCVDVRDTGAGIEADALPHIFDAFDQGGAHITRQFGGLGLGLAIGRVLAEMHGGSLSAHSDGHGRGATFTLCLASAAPAEATAADRGLDHPAPPPPPPPPPPSSPAAPRLLLVEDHADTARLMKRLLSSLGYDVRTAATVADARAAAADHRPDVVVSDVGLPDGTGYDLMRHLTAGGPVRGIALSGYGMEEDVRRAFAAGFAAHLTKPVNVEQLQVVIQRLLGREARAVGPPA